MVCLVDLTIKKLAPDVRCTGSGCRCVARWRWP